jgi:hypothetical protein
MKNLVFVVLLTQIYASVATAAGPLTGACGYTITGDIALWLQGELTTSSMPLSRQHFEQKLYRPFVELVNAAGVDAWIRTEDYDRPSALGAWLAEIGRFSPVMTPEQVADLTAHHHQSKPLDPKLWGSFSSKRDLILSWIGIMIKPANAGVIVGAAGLARIFPEHVVEAYKKNPDINALPLTPGLVAQSLSINADLTYHRAPYFRIGGFHISSTFRPDLMKHPIYRSTVIDLVKNAQVPFAQGIIANLTRFVNDNPRDVLNNPELMSWFVTIVTRFPYARVTLSLHERADNRVESPSEVLRQLGFFAPEVRQLPIYRELGLRPQ